MLVLLGGLIAFMFWNSRKRQRALQAEQEKKRTQMVPGVKVLMQGGLYGSLYGFDPEDPDHPAEVEIAPGVVIEVHPQAILRIIDPEEGLVTEDEFIEAEADEAEYVADVDEGLIEEIDSIALESERPAPEGPRDTNDDTDTPRS